MQIKIDDFIINYTEEEKEYIDDFVNNLLKNKKSIMDFFELQKLEYPVIITFWNDLYEYRKYRNEELKKYNRTVQPWVVASASFNKAHFIDILSLNQMRKCQYHENDTIKDIFLVAVHEFVHACHREYKKYKETLTWVNEGLATVLSNQFDDDSSYKFNTTKEDLLMAQSNYFCYFKIMKYILENKSKEYIMELIKNKDMQEQELNKIFDEFMSINSTQVRNL